MTAYEPAHRVAQAKRTRNGGEESASEGGNVVMPGFTRRVCVAEIDSAVKAHRTDESLQHGRSLDVCVCDCIVHYRRREEYGTTTTTIRIAFSQQSGRCDAGCQTWLLISFAVASVHPSSRKTLEMDGLLNLHVFLHSHVQQ